MARTIEEVVQMQLGSLAMQVARLIVENETLKDTNKELETKLNGDPGAVGPKA